jgi:hypothetical protein
MARWPEPLKLDRSSQDARIPIPQDDFAAACLVP